MFLCIDRDERSFRDNKTTKSKTVLMKVDKNISKKYLTKHSDLVLMKWSKHAPT